MGVDTLQLDLAILEHEIKHLDRFNRLSVLLIDYAMPTMNGLDFCANLADRDVRRVLLTGVADEKTAVQAFNDGLIDHYLPKAKLASIGGIVPLIYQQQQWFFQRYHARLSKALGISAPLFTYDLKFRKYFDKQLRKHAIVEYYLVTTPVSFLCLDEHGETYHLLIQDDYDKQASLAALAAHNAPPKLIKQVITNQKMVCFFEHPDDYLGNEQFPWSEVTFDVTNIEGQESWQCAMIKGAPMDIDFDPAEASYHKFLQSVGQRA